MPSPMNRARTIFPGAKHAHSPASPPSPIRRVDTAGVALPAPTPAPELFETENAQILDSEVFDFPALEIIETPERGTWITTALSTVAEYSRAMATWYQEDLLNQTYAAEADFEDMVLNSFLLKDDQDGQWNPGSPLFDVEASFGAMGHGLGTGLYFRRLFWNAKLSVVHAPVFFLRQFPEQEFVEFPMVCGCLDDCLALGGLESVGAFTAWLSVTPVVSVPVNTTLLTRISLREVPTEPGKKPSKAKKMFISAELVSSPGPDEGGDEILYVKAEGLFIRPGEGGFDLRRYVMYGPVESSKAVRGGADLEARAEEIVQNQVEEAGDDGPGNLEQAKALRAGFMALLKDATTGQSVRCRARNPEALEAQWVETHPIFLQVPELLFAPAAPVPGGEYLSGLAMTRFSHYPCQKEASGLGEEEGKRCVVGAVHFLPPVEGPPGLAHGGSIYGIFEQLFKQALKSPSLGVACRTTPTTTTITTTNTIATGVTTTATTTTTSGMGARVPLADQDPELVLKVQYKGQLPLNGTYQLECRVSDSEADPKTGAAQRILRGTLKSLDGQTVYNTAEAVLPFAPNDCVAAPAPRSRL